MSDLFGGFNELILQGCQFLCIPWSSQSLRWGGWSQDHLYHWICWTSWIWRREYCQWCGSGPFTKELPNKLHNPYQAWVSASSWFRGHFSWRYHPECCWLGKDQQWCKYLASTESTASHPHHQWGLPQELWWHHQGNKSLCSGKKFAFFIRSFCCLTGHFLLRVRKEQGPVKVIVVAAYSICQKMAHGFSMELSALVPPQGVERVGGAYKGRMELFIRLFRSSQWIF